MAQNGKEVRENRLSGQMIVDQLVRNMQLGQFEMAYSILLPCIFSAYLHPDDHGRLSSIFDLLVEDAKMDLALYASDEVSREHLVLRRDAATSQFFATDKNTNGTWIDGKRLKKGVEQPLPERAEIGVAEVLTLLFQVRR